MSRNKEDKEAMDIKMKERKYMKPRNKKGGLLYKLKLIVRIQV